LRWRGGKHVGWQPTLDRPKPRNFTFEVEYSTFDDKIYGLADLTVKSYLELAYQMGQTAKRGKSVMLSGSEHGFDDASQDTLAGGEDEKDGDPSANDHDGGSEEEEEGEEATDGQVGGEKGDKKKKKKQKRKKPNKTWMHFLKHAFVSTVDKKGLEKLA